MKYAIVLAVAAAIVVLSLAALITLPVGSNKVEHPLVSAEVTPDENSGDSSNYIHVTVKNESEAPRGNYLMKVYTDKRVYLEGSTIRMTAEIMVPENLSRAEVKFFGIKNRYGSYRVREKAVLDLEEGLNTVNASTALPLCSACAGIKPGEFIITAVLRYHNEDLINSTASINLTK